MDGTYRGMRPSWRRCRTALPVAPRKPRGRPLQRDENLPERGRSRKTGSHLGCRRGALRELNREPGPDVVANLGTCVQREGVPKEGTEAVPPSTDAGGLARKPRRREQDPAAGLGRRDGADDEATSRTGTPVVTSRGDWRGPRPSTPLGRRSPRDSRDPSGDARVPETRVARTSCGETARRDGEVSKRRAVDAGRPLGPSYPPQKGGAARRAGERSWTPEALLREDGRTRLRFGSVHRGGGEKILVSDAESPVAAVLDFSLSSSPAGRKDPNAARGRREVQFDRTLPGGPDARVALLGLCGQDEVLGFDRVLDPGAAESYRKIGEGVYGEAFRRTGAEGATTVVKVVPVHGDALVNGERQKTMLEILPEVVISLELSSLAGARDNSCTNFVHTKRVCLVRGRYHPALLRAWDVFHEEHRSQNDRPDLFEEEQHFVVFELADGGCDLETWRVKGAREARSIFLQVACTLAVAEAAFEYEHRDLHLGNVLVSATSLDEVAYVLHGEAFAVPSSGVYVSIIDHTLSRMRKGGNILFADLSRDPSLFAGRGDYQFQVYRLVRQHNENNWEEYHPYSNVLWLHYLLKKLRRRKERRPLPSCRAVWNQLDSWCREILECRSATDFVLGRYRAGLRGRQDSGVGGVSAMPRDGIDDAR